MFEAMDNGAAQTAWGGRARVLATQSGAMPPTLGPLSSPLASPAPSSTASTEGGNTTTDWATATRRDMVLPLTSTIRGLPSGETWVSLDMGRRPHTASQLLAVLAMRGAVGQATATVHA